MVLVVMARAHLNVKQRENLVILLIRYVVLDISVFREFAIETIAHLLNVDMQILQNVPAEKASLTIIIRFVAQRKVMLAQQEMIVCLIVVY